MDRILAIDPGDVHVGVATWHQNKFIDAWEVNSNDILTSVKQERPTLIVIESFRLQPWRAKTQSWSSMDTSQQIGAIQYIATDILDCSIRTQSSSIQSIIKRTPFYRAHIDEHGKPSSPHAHSALLHGLYFIHLGRKG